MNFEIDSSHDEMECANCGNWIDIDTESKEIELSICDNCLHPNYYQMHNGETVEQGVEDFLKKINRDCKGFENWLD